MLSYHFLQVCCFIVMVACDGQSGETDHVQLILLANLDFFTFPLKAQDEHSGLFKLQQKRGPLVGQLKCCDGDGCYFLLKFIGGNIFSLREVPEDDGTIGRAGHEGALDEAATIEGLVEGKNDQLAIVHSASLLKILYNHTNTPHQSTPAFPPSTISQDQSAGALCYLRQMGFKLRGIINQFIS